MFIACVTVYVKPEYRDKFITATIENAQSTRTEEPNNLRFDFLECDTDPNRFFLYEVFTDEDASAEHKTTNHYLEWREKVEVMMARSREGVIHSPIFPKKNDAFQAR
ncbi:MAG: antibiotic biosynthesis monooxygenase [Candidatus Heimdallarchaeota archaeon]